MVVFSSMDWWRLWLWLCGYWRGVEGGDQPVVGVVVVFRVCEDLALVWWMGRRVPLPVGLPSNISLVSIDMDPSGDVVPWQKSNGAEMLCLLMGADFLFFCLFGRVVNVVGCLSAGGIAIAIAGLGIVMDGSREKVDVDSSRRRFGG